MLVRIRFRLYRDFGPKGKFDGADGKFTEGAMKYYPTVVLGALVALLVFGMAAVA